MATLVGRRYRAVCPEACKPLQYAEEAQAAQHKSNKDKSQSGVVSSWTGRFRGMFVRGDRRGVEVLFHACYVSNGALSSAGWPYGLWN